MKLKFLFFGLLFTIISFAQNTAKVSGIITDKDSKQPVSFASISLKGIMTNTESDINGNYEIAMKPGSYTLVYAFIGYKTFEKQVTVADNETLNLNVALQENSNSIEGIVITGTTNKTKETALLKEQQKAVEIKQSIGAQEMSRKGISDVEEGLTKVTGITKVESRGLFVRGLEDRYNNLLVNDLQAPSNSPFKKIIPLDLFPTDIVGVLGVYKTFNPNISGDFAGATINIETSEAIKSQTKLSVGFGYTTGNNGEDFLMSEDANTTQGALGILKKDRALPGVFGSVPSANSLTSTEYAATHKQNSWNVDKVGSPMNTNISLLHSEKFKVGDGNNLSYILSLNTENKYVIRKGVERYFEAGDGAYTKNVQNSEYKYQTASSALVGIKYKGSRGSIGVTSFYLRSTESLINDQIGVLNYATTNPNRWLRINQFEQSDYFNNQILANYNLTKNEKHSIKAGFSYVKTAFGQPDRKSIVGNRVNDTDISITYGGNNLNRQYLDVKGNYYMSGLFEYNMKFGKEVNNKTNKLSVGYNSFRNNLYSTYRFVANLKTSPVFTTNLNDINDVIASDVANGNIKFQEESNPDYKVKLDHFVNAGYVNLFLNFGEKFEVNAGVRFENSDRTIKYRSLGAPAFDDPYQKVIENKLDILPSINTKYTVNDDSNMRLAVSKTITRPVTMEKLPITYVNPDGSSVIGNKDLKDSENINVDLKYELFTDKKDMLALGVFGKNITKPIERVFIATGGAQTTSFQNSKTAVLFGAELEFIFQLERISKQLENISWGFNSSIMKTKVNVDLVTNSIENSSTRNLQGASNWLVNSDLKYEFDFSKEVKNTATLVYGVYGKRIYAVGTAGLDHVYEKPFSKLDFVWNTKLSKNLDVKFSVDNILNPTYQLELGDESTTQINESSLIMKDYKRGVGFSLNIGYTF
ncbi:TonB-dependent receptor [Flavobacterium terrigena]|uniref:CarboxypepD_reg-like domain-containing protein n=1 Tax=Flavobacterium terrigena TaxID=402734 RepID=A0A1H6VIM7_9FLAO|nr:TonB-dependent receptor [Flavobacterium terrigena]SEJ04471.1 CarboxypepD_reg-like domain-containing protein [Flavobacterium terrigena]